MPVVGGCRRGLHGESVPSPFALLSKQCQVPKLMFELEFAAGEGEQSRTVTARSSQPRECRLTE